MKLLASSAVAGLIAALISLVAFFAYAAVKGKPSGDEPKLSVYVGMSLATFLVGALSWALADAAGAGRAACASMYG